MNQPVGNESSNVVLQYQYITERQKMRCLQRCRKHCRGIYYALWSPLPLPPGYIDTTGGAGLNHAFYPVSDFPLPLHPPPPQGHLYIAFFRVANLPTSPPPHTYTTIVVCLIYTPGALTIFIFTCFFARILNLCDE